MTCPDCARAALGPWHCFTGGCKGCEARALAEMNQPKGPSP